MICLASLKSTKFKVGIYVLNLISKYSLVENIILIFSLIILSEFGKHARESGLFDKIVQLAGDLN